MADVLMATLDIPVRAAMLALLVALVWVLWIALRTWWAEEIVPRGDALEAAQRARREARRRARQSGARA